MHPLNYWNKISLTAYSDKRRTLPSVKSETFCSKRGQSYLFTAIFRLTNVSTGVLRRKDSSQWAIKDRFIVRIYEGSLWETIGISKAINKKKGNFFKNSLFLYLATIIFLYGEPNLRLGMEIRTCYSITDLRCNLK